MKERRVTIANKLGLHARAAAKVVHTASRFSSNITIASEDEEVNAKSILGLLTLAASKGSTLTVRAEGDDEIEAVEALARLFEDRFGEEQ